MALGWTDVLPDFLNNRFDKSDVLDNMYDNVA
jgi:hypothetical protein